MMTSQSKESNYRWNFIVNLLDGASFWFGNSFISAATILPLFVSKLTPSLWPIGLLSVITSAGWLLPQLFAARITERFKKMKTINVGWGLFLERMPIWVMILSALLAKPYPAIALGVFLVCLTWHTIGAGVIATSWMALMAKIFSPEKRGSFLGTTLFIGAGMGALGSGISAWLLESYEFPDSFVVIFIIAAVFITISWFFLSLTREPQGEVEPHDHDSRTYWKDLFKILEVDHNFRRYVLSNIVITLGGMGIGFVTISAIQRFQVSDGTVGFFTLSILLGQTAGNLVLGWMADRYGHKLSLEIGVLATLIAFIITIFLASPSLYFVVYFLLGINSSSAVVSGMLVVWEFCDPSRIPTYSGMVNTTRGVFSLVAPMIAIQLAQRGFEMLFGVCAILTLAGLIILWCWVREPRWQN